MSYPTLSEYNVIVVNFETTTFIPIVTITRSTNTTTLDKNYPSIIVNIYNETNLFILNSTRSLLSTLASFTSGTTTTTASISYPFLTITPPPPPLSSFVDFSSALTNLTASATKTAVTTTASSKNDTSFQNSVIVPLYAVIFLLSVVGNFLVILTLAQNKRMRTVTNVYLLNLAVSDLLLGVFCMPFTLVGQMLRNFIFGRLMCKLIPYFQAVSVSVAVWTLVAISLERYFAICRPLTSRRWQTQFHAYKMILLVWIISFACNSPLLIVQQLQPMTRAGGSDGANKCREVWPSRSSERTYVIFLDIALLLLPLLAMGLAYSLIVSKLWRGLKREMKHTSTCSSTKELRRSPSLNTVNGVLINNDQIQNTNLSSPSRQHKNNNRIILPPPHLNSTSGNKSYVNLLQKKIQNSSKKSKSKLNILNNSNANNKKSASLKTGQNSETVKLWLFKSIVHVKQPQKSSNGGNGNNHGPTGTTNSNTNSGGQNNLRANAANKPTNFPNNNESIMSENELNCTDGGSSNNGGGGGNGNGNSSNNGNGGIDIKEDKNGVPDITTYTFCRHAIRSTYMDKSIEAKKKVIRMLFVIIVEFFVCWAPIHILNTVYLFSPAFVYHHVSSTGIALVQLMAYISSCCNPITYCFMNRRFRQAFMAIFNCYKCRRCCTKTQENGEGQNSIGRHELIAGIPCNSDASGNDSIVYLGRTNGLNRSEILVLEAEDRV